MTSPDNTNEILLSIGEYMFRAPFTAEGLQHTRTILELLSKKVSEKGEKKVSEKVIVKPPEIGPTTEDALTRATDQIIALIQTKELESGDIRKTARLFGVSPNSIQTRLRRKGIKANLRIPSKKVLKPAPGVKSCIDPKCGGFIPGKAGAKDFCQTLTEFIEKPKQNCAKWHPGEA